MCVSVRLLAFNRQQKWINHKTLSSGEALLWNLQLYYILCYLSQEVLATQKNVLDSDLIFLQSFFVIESNKPSVTLWQCSGEMHVLCFPHATGAWVIGFEQVLYLGTFDCNVAMFCDHDDICWSTFSRKLSVTWQIQITWNVTDHAAYCGKHSLYINQAKCEI